MKTYGLVGYPLGHSFSKQYFEQKFANENVVAQFLNFEMADLGDLRRVLIENITLQGFSVTIPYKEQIIPLLDEVDENAKIIGAVNAVKVIREGNCYSLKGYNTDYLGFGKSLDSFLGDTHLSQAFILGTGGASKAVAFALEKRGIAYVKVSRLPSNYEESYGNMDVREVPLIINTTPLGTFPQEDTFPPIPYEQLNETHYLFDLVYNPSITAFLAKGQQQNTHTQNGLSMLYYQADCAWDIWNFADL